MNNNNNTWCSHVNARLDAFNKAYIARKGKGIIPFIELHGLDDDIKACAQKEAELFYSCGLLKNATVCIGVQDTKDHQAYLLKANTEILDKKEGSIYFFSDSCSQKHKNVFDVRGCASVGLLSEIAAGLGFENLTKDILKAELEQYPEWMSYDTEQMVNNTIIRHYMTYSDNIFHADDLSWLRNKKQKSQEKAENMKLQERSKPEKHILEEAEQTEKGKKQHKFRFPTNGHVLPKQAHLSAESAAEEQTSPVENTNSKTEKKDIHPQEQSEQENAAPVPQMKKKVSTGIVKEKLTEEEERANQEKLNALLKTYQEAIEFITSLRNAKWRSIVNKMNDAVNNKKFTQQWCPLYLELSDDISSELYAKLYDVDQQTIQFNKTVIHQVVSLGCPNCGKEWQEDITFRDKGIHQVECPICCFGMRYERK